MNAKNNHAKSEAMLSRATSCFYKAIHLSKPNAGASTDEECYEEAIMSLAYVKMELNDPVGALETCKHMLDGDASIPTSATSRMRAVCRLYAAEAHCLLGDATAAMLLIFGSSEINEVQLKEDVNNAGSPVHWLAQGFAIDEKKKSSEVKADSIDVQVERLLEYQELLYHTLKKEDTDAAIYILRGNHGIVASPLL